MIKLYHGTTEKNAKTAPIVGIKQDVIQLTTYYASFQAFSASQADERWGIIEVKWDQLIKNLVPDADLMKGRGRKSWRESLDTVGMCVLKGSIPANAIGRIIIYDPRSNWFITRLVLHLGLGAVKFKEQQRQLKMLHRWFVGDFFFIEEWLGPEKEKFNKQELDTMGEMLNNRSGLDVFHHG